MGKRELIALLNLSSWCLVMVERLFLAVPWGCLQFVIVVFPDHTHLLFSTCQFDPEVYATRHDPKIYLHTKFRIPTSNYIQISSELDLARTETRGKVTVTWKHLVTLQGPRCIYIPNMECYHKYNRRSALGAFFKN